MNKTILYMLMFIILSSLVYAVPSTDRTDYYNDGAIYMADLIGNDSTNFGLNGTVVSDGDSVAVAGWTVDFGTPTYEDTYPIGDDFSIFINAADERYAYTLNTEDATFTGSMGFIVKGTNGDTQSTLFRILDTNDIPFEVGIDARHYSPDRWMYGVNVGQECTLGQINFDILSNYTVVFNWTNSGQTITSYINGTPCNASTNMAGFKSIIIGTFGQSPDMFIGDFWVSIADRPEEGAPASGVPASPVFVAPTPVDNHVNNTNQTFNVTHSSIDVGFYMWVNDSTYIINKTGSTITGGVYFNFTSNFTDGNYFLKFAVINRTNNNFSANITRTLTLGSIPPEVTLNTNNLFLADNSTIVYADYGLLNITVFDDSDLDSFLINITDKDNNVMFNFTNSSLTGFTSYTFEYNLSTLLFVNGTYFVNIFASDTHTALSINNYVTRTENKKITYYTTENINIEISTNEDAITSTTKLKDRYDFGFIFADKGSKQRTFTLKSDNKIKYIPNSRYQAHFVIHNGESIGGNWVDFEGIDSTPVVVRISDYEYQIIFDDSPNNIKFNSIGGLNVIHESYQFDFFTAERVTLIGRDVLTNLYVTQLNYTITDLTRGNITNYLIGDNTTLNLTGLRQGIYNVSIVHPSYSIFNGNFEVTTNPTETFIFDLSIVAIINLFDEDTGGYFNVSSADDIEMHVFCSNETVTTTLTANISSIPITCEYEKIRFIVEYGTDSYFRTLIIPFVEAANISVYLINLDTTTSIFNSLIVDDLFKAYDNPSIYVYRTIAGGEELITSDFVDIEDKIAAYLIENAEYSIIVNSDNQPPFIFGSYIAAEAGDKALRLYDFDVTPQPSGWSVDVAYSTQIMNLTGSDVMGNRTVVTFYNDSANGTTNLVWTIYENQIGGATLVTSTLANTLDATFTWDIPVQYNTTPLAVELVMTHTSGEHTASWILQEVTEIILGIEDYINSQFLNWFITLLLALIAIISTIRTSDVITFVILGLAAVFIMFGWYKVSWAILVLCMIISLMYFLKKQSDRPVGTT